MAISLRSEGTWETAGSNATSYQFAIPTHQANDLLLLRCFIKPSNGTSPATISPSIDQDWSIIAGGSGYTYTNSSANGSGSLYALTAWKKATSSSETGPTVTFGTSTSPAEGVITVFQRGTGETWATPVAVHLGYTDTSSISVTLGSNPGVTAGDMCVAGIGHADNDTLTSPTFTQSGVTYATVVECPAAANSSGNGNDIAGDGCYRLASSGTATAAPVVTASASASQEGEVSFTRLRVSVATEASAGIATATAAAYGATFSLAPNAGVATATVETEFGDSYYNTVIGDSPAAYWRLGESSGSAADEIGTADGTYTNTPTLGVTGLLTGDPDTAVTFDRASYEYVDIASNMPAGTSAGVTMEAMIAIPSDPGYDVRMRVFNWGNLSGSNQSHLLIWRHYSATEWFWSWMFYDTASRSANTSTYASAPFATDGSAHHLAVVHDYVAKTCKVYIDGSLSKTIDLSAYGTPTTMPSGEHASFPAWWGNSLDAFTGTLDEVAYYTSVLDDATIAAHAAAATGGGAGSVGAIANVGPVAVIASSTAAALDATAQTSGGTNVNAGLASATAAAYGVTASISAAPTAGIATTTAAANAATATVAPNAGAAAATAAAHAATASVGVNAATATATGAALAATASIAANAGLASATAAALDASVSLAAYANAGLATATAAAAAAAASIGANAGTATATAAGLDVTPSISLAREAGIATAIAAALDATASTAATTYADAGLAAAAAAALDVTPSISLAPTAGVATATAAAIDATASTSSGVNVNAGLATATATAHDAAFSLAPAAGIATATATALAAIASLGANAGTASATAAAPAATVSTSSSATAGLASATAAAYGATFAGTSSTVADAGLATAVGAALPVTFHVLPAGGIADATGAALPGSASVGPNAGRAQATAAAYAVLFSSTSNILVFAGLAEATAAATGIRPGSSGGVPPDASAVHASPRGDAALLVPVGTASHPTPEA